MENLEAIDPNYDDQESEESYTQEEIAELKELYAVNNERVLKRSYLLNRLAQWFVINEKDLINDSGFYKMDRFVKECLLYCDLQAGELWLLNYIERNTMGKMWQSYVELNQRKISRVYNISQTKIFIVWNIFDGFIFGNSICLYKESGI